MIRVPECKRPAQHATDTASIGPARMFAWFYVQTIRSVPSLVLLFLIYHGVRRFLIIRSSFL